MIDDAFPGGYQVEVADVNGDKKPDIVALGGSTLAWYENPTWTKRVVSTSKETPDIISSATADLDGDGMAEIAIAYDFSMNEPKRGKLLLAIQGAKVDDPWTFTPMVDANQSRGVGGGIAGGGGSGGTNGAAGRLHESSLSRVPSIHRLRWGIYPSVRVSPGSVSFEKKQALFVASIFGPSAKPPLFNQDPARLVVFDPGAEPKSGHWKSYRVGEAPVLHAIELVDLGDQGVSTVLGASNQGVTSYRLNPVLGVGDFFQASDLATGALGEAPKKGSSEVHLGKLRNGRKFLATVEPWHGTDVVVYLSESLDPLKFGPRTVIDTSLKEGHALWVADVDGDGDDEVFAGYRGGGGGVLMFDRDGSDWVRTILDPGVTAQDLRGGDLDGDGRPDVVAIGGQSHNVVWYRPIPNESKKARD
ncbi:FG-GAP repeat domain-containing protein [Tundrisphaera lichenicola]|uniref:FG-GAP repeat domain-containing protein n=1 Tax=Tundrisphaera lichenicola TaxID=2029860 RepID=UPI003EB77BF9